MIGVECVQRSLLIVTSCTDDIVVTVVIVGTGCTDDTNCTS